MGEIVTYNRLVALRVSAQEGAAESAAWDAIRSATAHSEDTIAEFVGAGPGESRVEALKIASAGATTFVHGSTAVRYGMPAGSDCAGAVHVLTAP